MPTNSTERGAGRAGDPGFPAPPAVVPDFVIVGAPKCGTTALFAYLSTHPGIAASSRKEPFFWCTDVGSRDKVTDPEAYSRLWDGAPAGALKGEATTGYITSRVAIPAILRQRPDARFILMLRKPSEMAAAFHSQMVRSFNEDVGDFEKAWRLQPARRAGKRIPRECADPAKLQYERVCALGDQLERFTALVPEPNRLVILFDDFAADTRGAYLRTLRFLGLPDDGRRSFERVNENEKRRSVRLGIVHRAAPLWLGPLYPPLRAAAARVGISPSRIVNFFNSSTAPRRPLRPAFEAELVRTFVPQVEKVEALLGRDLAHWKHVTA